MILWLKGGVICASHRISTSEASAVKGTLDGAGYQGDQTEYLRGVNTVQDHKQKKAGRFQKEYK